jgi:hypothetical protein
MKTHLSRLIAVSVLLFGVAAHAAPLNLNLADAPNIFSDNLGVQYGFLPDTLTVSGNASTLDDDGVGAAEPIDSTCCGTTFNLSATIDSAGMASGGSLIIGGTVAALGFNSGTLLTGTLSSFGFPAAGGDSMEFVFDVTGGDAAGLFGAQFGVVLTGTGLSPTLFSEGFNTRAVQATAASIIPIPAAVWLFGSGLIGLVGLARRRKSA